MPRGSDQDKTEPATPKRRQEARKKGQVAQSREIPSVFVLVSALGVFLFSGLYTLERLTSLMRSLLQNIGTLQFESGTVFAFLLQGIQQMILILMPVMLAVLIAGIAANLIQVGFLFTPGPLTPKLTKLNPISGMKKFVSIRALEELVKSLIKLLVVGGVAFLMVRSQLDSIPSMIQMSVGGILSFIANVSFKICFYTCLVLIVLAASDYAFQRWQHEKDLRMTKQEVKDERKQSEGDPSVKARIKSVQRDMARRRMMEAVPNADVVITNPTSLAIALQYEAEKMMAPRVVAKGAGFIAERIKKIAEKNDVPILEHKPLAHTLFKVEIGDFIPVNLYRAIAEILAYVYRLKGNKSY